MVKIIKSTENEAYDLLKEKYKGFAACLVNCVYDREGFFVTGQVFAYGSSVPEIMEEVFPIMEAEPDDIFGQVKWDSFKGFDGIGYGPIQVVVHE